MDRELLLLVLAMILCGPALFACGWWPSRDADDADALALEARRWRRLWLPLLPALVAVGALTGWALVEPASAESMPPLAVLVAAALAFVPVRALVRACRSATARRPAPAMTVGLWRPRIVLSAALESAVDGEVVDAVTAHEEAHARHRDPLRIWLGQLATDLQWPWPQARRRLESWLESLELARDDEARRRGADGPDLAAGILAAARLCGDAPAAVAAPLHRPTSSLSRRIDRLLAPLAPEAIPSSSWTWWLAVGALFVAAVLFGLVRGESLLRAVVALR